MKFWRFFAGIVVLLVLAIGFDIYLPKILQHGMVQKAAVASAPTLSDLQNVVDSHEVFSIPAIISTSSVLFASLPTELGTLVPRDATDIQTFAVRFTQDQNGFQVFYAESSSPANSYYGLLFQSLRSWQVVVAARTSLAGMIEAEKSSQLLRIDQVYKNGSTSSVVNTTITAL